jgi:hypothetical protein
LETPEKLRFPTLSSAARSPHLVLSGGSPTGRAGRNRRASTPRSYAEFGGGVASRCPWDVFNEAKGVCRDYAHLAIYLGDIGMPPPYGPMDFAGWFEAYLGGRWYTFDARNNMPRIGRVLIAQGRDAADVPITHTFGPNTLVSFKVWTDEIT